MTSDRIVAAAQVLLSAIYISGYFWSFGRFLDGDVQTPEAWKEVVISLISVLTAGMLAIVNFWFSRSRQTP